MHSVPLNVEIRLKLLSKFVQQVAVCLFFICGVFQTHALQQCNTPMTDAVSAAGFSATGEMDKEKKNLT